MNTNEFIQKPVRQLFFHYLIPAICGTMVTSIYVLADTIFIGKRLGATALAALNISLPIYNIFFGLGLLSGVGGSVLMSICRGKSQKEEGNTYFTTALLLNFALLLISMTVCVLFMEDIAWLLGGTEETMPYIMDYLPYIIWGMGTYFFSSFLQTFIRNDGAPKLAMNGVIAGGVTNIVLDYIFIYPLGMEMAGAATATATAPVISMLIMSVHFIKKNNRFHITKIRLSLKRAADICFLGVSSLVLELSSGIVIIVFNFLILKLNGNTGVAAYGILANIALVLTSVFTGIAQGIQPIVSRHADAKGKHVQNSIRKYALITSLLLSLVSYITISLFSVPIAEAFNKADDPLLTTIASGGMRIYFINLFFAGVNIIASAFLCSCDKPKLAFVISVLRGFILIIPAAWILSSLFGLTGIWLTVPVTEAIVCLFSFLFLFRGTHTQIVQST